MESAVQDKGKPWLLLSLLVILAVAAGIYMAYCTDYAPWGFSDSAAYFSAARNLANGHSLSVSTVNGGYTPLNLHAPLYSLVLAVFVKFNANLVSVSKGMDILFWGIFIFLCGWLFFRITGRQVEAFFFALVCGFSYPLAVSFSSLMSEPLALVLGIPGFLLLILAVRNDSNKWMIISAACIGLSVLTRFAFAAVLGAGVLVLLIFSTQPWRRRWISVLIFGLAGAAPMVIWTVLQKLQEASTGGRSLVFVDIFSKARHFAAEVWGTLKYWMPYRSNMIPGVSAKYFTPLLAALLLLLIVVGILAAVQKLKRDVWKEPVFLLAGSSLLFILSYFAVAFAGYAFTTAPNDINDRILSPVFPAIIALLLCSTILVGMLVRRRGWTHLLALAVTLFFVVFNFELLRTYGILSSKYPNGYTSPYWNGSPIFEAIQKLPPDTALASNAPDITLFYTNRMPYCLTENPTQRGECISSADRPQLQDFVERQCGVLVLFPSSPTENYENYADPISQVSMDGLNKLYPAAYRSSPGVILYWPECSGVKQALAGE
jgi:4-amino-4-deoxy-L-arabinose transferase-like glycosyltransferase